MKPICELSIVCMKAVHIETLAEIEKLCFSNPWSFQSLAEELSNPLAAFFVAELEGKIVGYAGMNYILDEGYIANIAVHPNFRCKGIAFALLLWLETFADENKLELLTLEVRRSNHGAIRLYKKAGFDEKGVRRNFYTNPPEDGLIMTKYL